MDTRNKNCQSYGSDLGGLLGRFWAIGQKTGKATLSIVR
jgi:hypothetical protein